MRRTAVFMSFVISALALATCVNDLDILYLVPGSQGEAGDTKVYDLYSGSMYLVKIGYNWYPVKEDGTLGRKLIVLNYLTVDEAFRNDELQPLASGVTEITGFSNDQIVNVFAYIRGKRADSNLLPDDTKQRNTVVDMTHSDFTSVNSDRARLTFEDGIEDVDSFFIFLTKEVNNYPESFSYSTDPRWPAPIQGGPDWFYELSIGTRGNLFKPSVTNPFRYWVSDEPGEKGYFCVSGPMPGYVEVRTKRGQGSVGTIGQ